MPLGLIALAVSAFGIGLTEFVIMGLLPQIAADYAVTESAAGWLISGYALGVVVGALALTAAAIRLPRKKVLLGLLILFIIGNVVTALAPTYEIAMIGRVIAALCHGAFFGIGSVVATSLVAPEKRAAAVAIMFTGLTSANVLGVPLGTFLGQQYGWQATFWVISVIGIIAFIGVAALVPVVRVTEVPKLRNELAAFRSSQVWLSLTVTVLAFGGMFGAFTYIAFTLTEVSGFSSSTVPWLLVLFGAGLVIGNWLGGRLADRALDKSLTAFIAALIVVLIAFALLASNPVATAVLLFLMGGFGFGTVPGLQTRIMNFASTAPTLASSANIGAFNIGNALGAWIGGLGISAGLGYTAPLWAGAIITTSALIVMIIAMTAARRVKRVDPANSIPATGTATTPTPVIA